MKNPSDLADKILYYLQNPLLAEENAKNGSEYTAWLFDVKRTAKEITEIYKKIIKEHDKLQNA